VQVHCDEAVAIRIGPEPCAGIRDDVGEASAGECVGQPLSRERNLVPGADAVYWAEGHAGGRAIASVHPTRRGLRPWHASPSRHGPARHCGWPDERSPGFRAKSDRATYGAKYPKATECPAKDRAAVACVLRFFLPSTGSTSAGT